MTIKQIKRIDYHYDGIKLINNLKSGGNEPVNLSINSVLYDFDGNMATTADQIKLIGTLTCDWGFNLKIDVGLLQGLKEVKFGVTGSENLDLQLVAGIQYSFKKEISLATVHFAPIYTTIGVVPFIFPIVVSPQLEILIGIDGSANASVTSKITQSLSFENGIRFLKDQGWSPYKTFDKSFSFQPPQLNVNASACAYLKPEFLIKIDYVAGPYANLKIYSRLDADLLQTPWWKLYGGITMNAGARVNIIDRFILDYTVSDLINYETLLTQSITPPVQSPTVTTNSITNITQTTASCGGNVSSDGGATVTARGVCWSTTQTPTTSNFKTTDGNGINTFTSNLTNLTANTTYYVRAYATNSVNTAYGNQVMFTTGQTISMPTVTTSSITSITQTTASSGGNVTSDGGAAVTARGVCWSTTQTPTTSNFKTTNGSGINTFTSNLTNLTANTTYYVRAYATNSVNTAYGNQVTFTTGQTISMPTVTTNSVSSITQTTASSGGNVTSDGGATVTARGVCWSTTQTPTIGNFKTTDGSGINTFTSNLTGLTANTTYYVRAYATNSAGTGYGNLITFKTTSDQTILSKEENVTAYNGEAVDFGSKKFYVILGSWGVYENALKFKTQLIAENFIPGILVNDAGLFRVSAYCSDDETAARNKAVEILQKFPQYSDLWLLIKKQLDTVTDIDGNVYHTVQIGTQVWMAENLKTTKYRNGDPIPNVTDNTSWDALISGAYCWFSNNATTYKATYGALYNWYSVADSRNIAPTGWHIPTDAEWTTLTTFLGGESVAGGKLKEIGTTHWSSSISVTNSSGFTALPGGHRLSWNVFSLIGYYGVWWSSTEHSPSSAWSRVIGSDLSRNFGEKVYGYSVRCLRD